MRFSFKYLVVSILFASLGIVAAQPTVPDGIEIFLFEKSERVLDPDSSWRSIDQQVWWTGKEGRLTSRHTIQQWGLPDYSYFREIYRVLPNPETGVMAFFAEHKLVNKGVVTLFLLQPDGTLKVPFATQPNQDLAEKSKYASGHGNYMQKVVTREQKQIPVYHGGTLDRTAAAEVILNHRRVAWVPGSQKMLLVSDSAIKVLDLEKGTVHEHLVDHLGVKYKTDTPFLNLAGGNRFGEHFYLYNEEGVHRVAWDGSVTFLFRVDRREPERDFFNFETIKSKKVRGYDFFRVFHDGAYFLIGTQVVDRTGQVIFQISPKKSRIAFSQSHSLVAATHSGAKILKVVDLEHDKQHFVKLKFGRVGGVSFDESGSFVCVQSLASGRRASRFEVFRLDQDGLVLAAEGKSSLMPAIVDGHLTFLNKQKLFVQKIGGKAQAFPPFSGKVEYWMVHRDGDVLFSNFPFFDPVLSIQENFKRAHQQMHLQQMMMDMRQ